MRILGIESASKSASAALWEDGRILSCQTLFDTRTHSETLLPLIDKTLSEAGITVQDVTAIAISAGPGSFTGLRIGAGIAKGLAFSVSCPLIAVPTLEAAAYPMVTEKTILCPVFDARRGEAYAAFATETNDVFTVLKPAFAAPMERIIEEAKRLSETEGKTVTFSGDGVAVFASLIHERFPLAAVLPIEQACQSAEGVARYGAVLFQEGKTDTAISFEPIYLRLSQAERERQEAGLTIEPEGSRTIEKNVTESEMKNLSPV